MKQRMEQQSCSLAAHRRDEDGHWQHWNKSAPAPTTAERSWRLCQSKTPCLSPQSDPNDTYLHRGAQLFHKVQLSL